MSSTLSSTSTPASILGKDQPIKTELAKIVVPSRAEMLAVIATITMMVVMAWVATTQLFMSGSVVIAVSMALVMFFVTAAHAGVSWAATPRVWLITRVFCLAVYAFVFWGSVVGKMVASL